MYFLKLLFLRRSSTQETGQSPISVIQRKELEESRFRMWRLLPSIYATTEPTDDLNAKTSIWAFQTRPGDITLVLVQSSLFFRPQRVHAYISRLIIEWKTWSSMFGGRNFRIEHSGDSDMFSHRQYVKKWTTCEIQALEKKRKTSRLSGQCSKWLKF